ncbi:MAG TPA: pilus assembly protein TadG-related protein [Candidatus Binatia bacterium]|nr:pilus assembly protein TadG-related protein [Candidatus Binatia bacterium]
MRKPFIQRPGRSASRRERERGVTIALIALAIFSIIAMAGLSIDVGTLYQASAEAQRSADAAALAAARELSISGITGDPAGTASWTPICGGSSSLASSIAISVANQNLVGGAAPSSVKVGYSAGKSAASATASDCTGLGGAGSAFGVNPVVTVQVTQASLSTYFSRIWGSATTSVSASASAEVFNPSGSDAYTSNTEVLPVQPRCVKPIFMPNLDPVHAPGCTGNGCLNFVSLADGAIQSPGLVTANGLIGERFWMIPDCAAPGSTCSVTNPIPQPNVVNPNVNTPNIQYVPGQWPPMVAAMPSGGACASVGDEFSSAIAGCDQSTQYQCGKTGLNTVNTTVNPGSGTGDATNAIECLIHASSAATASGQDWLSPFQINPNATPDYPFQIQAGSGNPLLMSNVRLNDVITSSTSLITVPIFDNSTVASIGSNTTTPVTVVGFLQLFVYAVDPFGDMYVAVMNVSGCGNAVTNPSYLTGTSPVPVRLITPP